MRRFGIAILLTFLGALPVDLVFPGIESLSAADWPQFRGADTTGIAPDQGVPTAWSDTDNRAWQADLPGRGLSGPIVLGNRVVLTASSGYQDDRLHVLCFAADTGRKLWERQFWATGRTMCHPKMCVATPTPASDGQRIFAFYSSNDVICLDLDGNLLWFRGLTIDYPNASNSLGMASSPVVVGSTLVLQVENLGQSFAAGLDVATGQNRWKIDRPILDNWTSPSVVRGKTREEDLVLLQSGKGLAALHPATGEIVWKYGEECSIIPSSAVADGVVYLPSKGLTALQIEAGNAAPKVLWESSKMGPSTPTPLVYQGQVFSLGKTGVLNAADVKTGESLWQLRLQGTFSGTPAIANGHLYLVNESGLAQVVRTGEKGEVVSTYDFKETVLSSPAIAGNAFYVRSDGHLWKIASK